MGANKKKKIKDAFNLIGFELSELDFIKEYGKFLEQINPRSDLNYWNVVISYCLRNIKESRETKKKDVVNVKFGFKRFKKSLTKFAETFNEKNKHSLRLAKSLKIGDNFFAMFNILTTSNTQQKIKSKSNPENIDDFFCVYLSRESNQLLYFRGWKYIINWVSWWFESKLKLKFADYKLKKFNSTNFINFLTNKQVKIFDIGFNHTKVSISDKIIIKSRKGEAADYYNKLKGTLIKKNLSIYDVDYLSFSYRNGRIQKLILEEKKDLTS